MGAVMVGVLGSEVAVWNSLDLAASLARLAPATVIVAKLRLCPPLLPPSATKACNVEAVAAKVFDVTAKDQQQKTQPAATEFAAARSPPRDSQRRVTPG